MAKGGGQIGGQGGRVKRIAWVFIAACIAVAMWQGAFKDPKGFFQDLVTKAGQIDTWISSLVDQFSSGGSPPAVALPATSEVQPVSRAAAAVPRISMRARRPTTEP